MSVRAYKIKKIELEETPSFNLWHDDKLVSLLEAEINRQIDESGGGLVEIPVEKMEEVVEELKGTQEEDRIEDLQEDIKKAKENNNRFIEYLFF